MNGIRLACLHAFVLSMLLFLAACGGGGAGENGGGSKESIPASVVTKSSALLPGPECPYGGITVETGIDENGNGLLDPAEVDDIQFVCHGAFSFVPAVVSTNPGHGDIDVAINQPIAATFNLPMAPTSFTNLTFQVAEKLSGTPIPGSYTYNGGIAVFTPAGNMASSTEVEVTLTTGITDANTIPLPQDYIWNFTTGVTTRSPAVLATNPVNGQTTVPITAKIEAVFLDDMNGGSLNGTTFTLEETGGPAVTGTVTSGLTSATFIPADLLKESQNYTATISTGAQNAQGVPMADPHVWTFTTGTRFWQGPEPVGDLGASDARYPLTGMDSSGNIVTVWHEFDGSNYLRLHAAKWDAAGGSWSTSAEVSDSTQGNVSSPKLVISSGGSGFLVWTQHHAADGYYNVRSRYFDPLTGDWAATIPDLTPALTNHTNDYSPSVAMNANGDSILASSRLTGNYGGGYHLKGRSAGLGGNWSGISNLTSTTNGDEALQSSTAIDGSGRTMVVFQKNYTDIAWMRNGGAGWSTATPFPEIDGTSDGPMLSITPGGDAVVVYRNHDGVNWNSIRAQTYNAVADSWTYAELHNDGNGVDRPQVGVDDAGNAIAIWTAGNGTVRDVLVKRFNNNGSAWVWEATPTPLESGTGDASSAQIAVMPNGNAWAVWTQVDGGGEISVYAARYDVAGNTWDAPALLEALAGDAEAPTLAVNSNGLVVVAWSHRAALGQSQKVYVNRYR